MSRKYLLILCLFLLAVPALAQTKNTTVPGLTVTCEDGTIFDNGVEIILVHVPAGYDYTATVVGLNGFDPILAVLDTKTKEGVCSNDEEKASLYEASLPSTGPVVPSENSAQVVFNQASSEEFADISLIVGGVDNTEGEFLVFLEGMSITESDKAGDLFSINVTPDMIDSGIPLTTYMISALDSKLDPLIYQTLGGPSADVLTDSEGDEIYCNDVGDANSCYDTDIELENYGANVATGGVAMLEYDAMLTTQLEGIELNQDRENNYLSYYMTSYQHKTEGEYLLVFHIGIGS
jgi:hypothetical protein